MANNLAIRLRKFNRICPIAGYKEKSIRVGAYVVIETSRGVESGQIVSYSKGFPKSLSRDVRLRKVIRYANESDIKKIGSLSEKEDKALRVASKKVKEHEILIKFIGAEYLFDDKKAHFYFKITTNKKGLNLKELTKDIASTLQVKVTMHQVNQRDEAKFHGGLGPCGRGLCCASWLDKPKHVTVRMVKEQGLQISSMKTSGICGRLMCCMQYEHEGSKKTK